KEPAAEGDAADGDAMRRKVGPQVHELVRRLDAIDAVDEVEAFEPVDHQLVAFVADDRVDGAHGALDGLKVAAELGDDGIKRGDLFGGETIGFGKDHKGKRAAGSPLGNGESGVSKPRLSRATRAR